MKICKKNAKPLSSTFYIFFGILLSAIIGAVIVIALQLAEVIEFDWLGSSLWIVFLSIAIIFSILTTCYALYTQQQRNIIRANVIIKLFHKKGSAKVPDYFFINSENKTWQYLKNNKFSKAYTLDDMIAFNFTKDNEIVYEKKASNATGLFVGRLLFGPIGAYAGSKLPISEKQTKKSISSKYTVSLYINDIANASVIFNCNAESYLQLARTFEMLQLGGEPTTLNNVSNNIVQ